MRSSLEAVRNLEVARLKVLIDEAEAAQAFSGLAEAKSLVDQVVKSSSAAAEVVRAQQRGGTWADWETLALCRLALGRDWTASGSR